MPTYIVEFNYEDDKPGLARGQCQVIADSEEEACEKAKRYYEKQYRPGLFDFRVNKDGRKFTNDDIVESKLNRKKFKSIHEGASVKRWAQSLVKEIFNVLKQNNIPSKDYAVLGHVEISPFIRFTVKNEDVDKVLELFPMAEPDSTYYKNATMIDIQYEGLLELEKQLKTAIKENANELKVGDCVSHSGRKGKVSKVLGDVVEVEFNETPGLMARIDKYYADELEKCNESFIDDELKACALYFDVPENNIIRVKSPFDYIDCYKVNQKGKAITCLVSESINLIHSAVVESLQDLFDGMRVEEFCTQIIPYVGQADDYLSLDNYSTVQDFLDSGDSMFGYALEGNFNVEKLATDVINKYGAGHELATYDNKTIEQDVEGVTYYIFIREVENKINEDFSNVYTVNLVDVDTNEEELLHSTDDAQEALDAYESMLPHVDDSFYNVTLNKMTDDGNIIELKNSKNEAIVEDVATLCDKIDDAEKSAKQLADMIKSQQNK